MQTFRPWARELTRVWFHELSPSDWFGGGAAVDALLERRFGDLWAALRTQPAGSFLDSPRTVQAAILLFDQVPRNIHRDSPTSYATDHLALNLTYHILRRGWLSRFTRVETQFILMPLMHSEHIADQRLSVQLFARHVPSSLSFAQSHWRMIARFGRFPHRNEVLGRRSTPAEREAIAAGFSW